jgi:hypothetical protein
MENVQRPGKAGGSWNCKSTETGRNLSEIAVASLGKAGRLSASMALLTMPGYAQSRFDGSWSVKITMDTGDRTAQVINISVTTIR